MALSAAIHPIARLIFTAVPYGKGYNPSLSGYQVKACSPSLSDHHVDLLGNICMHYGDAVYRGAPKDALDRELSWRTTTQDARQYPDEILGLFPKIISYTRIDEDLYALVQTSYIGLTYDNRPGNFLSLALILHPEDLVGFGGNPLSAVRSDIFTTLFPVSDIEAEGTSLSDIENLGSALFSTSFNRVISEPYLAQLPQLLNAIHSSSEQSRPVFLNLRDWRVGYDFLEEVLNLLPPPERLRVSLCSYETDRTWIPAVHGQKPAGWTAGHRLVLIGAPGGGVQFRADEVQSRFTVFNFPAGQFSLVEAGPYAEYAVECVQTDGYSRLEAFFRMLERMGLGGDVDTCNLLVGLGDHGNVDRGASKRSDSEQSGSDLGAGSSAEIPRAIEAFAGLAVKNGKPEIALSWLREQLDNLSEQDDPDRIHSLRIGGEILLGSLHGDNPDRKSFLRKLRQLAAISLSRGKVRSAVEYLHMTGAERIPSIEEVLSGMQDSGTVQMPEMAGEQEKTAWLDLLLEALSGLDQENQKVESPQAGELEYAAVVRAIFCAASLIGLEGEIWSRIGEAEVLPYLKDCWDLEKQSLAQDLLVEFDPVQDPEPTANLALILCRQGDLTADQWRETLQVAVKSAGGMPEPYHVLDEIEGIISGVQVSEGADPVVERTLLSGVVAGNLPSGDAWNRWMLKYLKGVEELKPAQRNEVHRRLAEAGVSKLLSQEFLAEALSIDASNRQNLVQHWHDVIFNRYPTVYDQVCLDFSMVITHQTIAQDTAYSLGPILLPKTAPQPLTPGIKALYESMVAASPLLPEDQGSRRGFQLPKGLSSDTYQRAKLIAFLERIGNDSRSDGWSLDRFPAKDDEWQKGVSALPSDQKQLVINWVLQPFRQNGVTTPEQTRGLVALLNHCGEINQLGEAFGYLLKDHDPVTWVIAGTALIDYAQKISSTQQAGNLVSLVLHHFDRTNRHLLEDHIWRRFNPPLGKARQKTAEICRIAGLAIPKDLLETPGEPSKPQETHKETEPQETSGSPVPGMQGMKQVVEKSTGILSKFGGLIRIVTGDAQSKPAEKPEDASKSKLNQEDK